MILFHGSNVEIEKIDLSRCRPYKDFGKGFYLTEIPEQAEKMARRVTRLYGGKPCVTYFEFDTAALNDDRLSVRVFDRPSKEWAFFVVNNRNKSFMAFEDPECNLDCKYDIVTGPIANDDLALLFRQFSRKLINTEELIRGMEYKQLTNQYSFHTERAICFLAKAGVSYYE